MTDIKKEKKIRTPRTVDSVTAGALALSLADKVELVKKLKGAIAAQVGDAQAIAKQATELVNGL